MIQTPPCQATIESAPCLQVHLLGPVSVLHMGRPLGVRRRQTRALLYFLAAHGQPAPREEICGALWPDVRHYSAHRCLSHLLSHLREALPEPNLVCCSNELVELNWSRVWSDVNAFQRACAVLDTQHEGVLREALGLYRGPFLAGFSLPDRPEFELWVTQQRSLLERTYLDALAVMVTAEANHAEWSRAIAYAREYLRVDELAEDMHRRLMVLHIMVGDRPAAMQQYQECVGILKRELGVPPMPQTRAIYEALVHGI